MLILWAEKVSFMEKILKVHSVNDYADYIGAPRLHPLVSVIHYDELEHCRHSLNNYDVYAIFIADEMLESLTYGRINYDLNRHALMCVAPGQIGGKTDTGEEIHTKGWALLFAPDLLHGTSLQSEMHRYSFFSYNINEALLLSDEQRQSIVQMLELIRQELSGGDEDEHTKRIVVAHISVVLELIGRYYATQMAMPQRNSTDILTRFENLLRHYYASNLQQRHGLPTVKYCAQELFLSPNYFGDLVKQVTGDSATNTIRRFVMQRASALLIAGHNATQTAEALGFEYPQHFTRQFKNYFGETPSAFQKRRIRRD